ncbi:hypothetical protein BJ742DRAFT_900253 [Cladochytrium replicatum]|nr:hypothetical protein BJ742DRAFT_900253 [Cladochytrium replicatum]
MLHLRKKLCSSAKSSGLSTPKESAVRGHDLPSIDLIKRLLSVKLRERLSGRRDDSAIVGASIAKCDLLLCIKKMGKSTGRITRPSNSFMTYRKAVEPLLLEQFLYLNNKALSVVIGQIWGKEEKDIKDHFAKLAEKAKKRHQELYPHYKYNPSKPKPKKRSASYGRTQVRTKQFLESIKAYLGSEVPSLSSSPASAPAIDLNNASLTNRTTFTGGLVSRSPSPETMIGRKQLWTQEKHAVLQQQVLPATFFLPDSGVQTCSSCPSRTKNGPMSLFPGDSFTASTQSYMNGSDIPIFNEPASMQNAWNIPMLTDLELQQLLAGVGNMAIIVLRL